MKTSSADLNRALVLTVATKHWGNAGTSVFRRLWPAALSLCQEAMCDSFIFPGISDENLASILNIVYDGCLAASCTWQMCEQGLSQGLVNVQSQQFLLLSFREGVPVGLHPGYLLLDAQAILQAKLHSNRYVLPAFVRNKVHVSCWVDDAE